MSPPKERILTKSLYKTAVECPTKLFYAKKQEFGSMKKDNPFLEALAQGGYQVGALAKMYDPEGIDVETLDREKALAETEKLLKQDEVVIFEAAFAWEECFIRVDVLRKKGAMIELLEVKAKSFGH